MKKITFTIPPEVFERLRLQAERERRSVSNLLTIIIDEWLTEKEGREKE